MLSDDQPFGAPPTHPAVWAEIDGSAYRHNLRALRRILAPGVRCMANVTLAAFRATSVASTAGTSPRVSINPRAIFAMIRLLRPAGCTPPAASSFAC